MSETKVLNLYAGIGGNRKLWEDVDVTAVEWDEEKAEVYQDHFPEDEVVVTDAHEYLKEHIFEDWDYIWTSPPCPTHSCMQPLNQVQHGAEYPDMDLWQEIVLLRLHAERVGYDYTVENVQLYYEPFYDPQVVARHSFWANFVIPDMELGPIGISGGFADRHSEFDYDEHESMMGYDLSEYDIAKSKRGKMLRNCVHPELGKHVFKSRGEQTTLF